MKVMRTLAAILLAVILFVLQTGLLALFVADRLIAPKALTEAIGARGERILTLPRGFYLKKNFTSALLARHFLIQ